MCIIDHESIDLSACLSTVDCNIFLNFLFLSVSQEATFSCFFVFYFQEDMDRAVTYYLKAIETAKDKPR